MKRIPSLKTLMYMGCAVSVLALSTACASLPEVSYVKAEVTAPSNPSVVSSHGSLSQRQSNALLNKRWHNSHTDIKALAAVEEAATGEPLIAGNKVTLLYDGPQTMTAMTDAIKAAKNHVNLETYIFDQDELGMRFADLLIAKQRAGVQINIIYDSVGTIGTPRAFFDRMREAGIRLTEFNPINPLRLAGMWRPNNRDHRKLLIVDGKIGFTGGVNINSTYSNSSLFRSKARPNSKVGWRDTHVQIEGPAVAALQWTFLTTWAEQKSPDLSDSEFFPSLQEMGNKLVRVLASKPGGAPDIYRAYVLAMKEAKKTIHITSAYFVPDQQVLHALCDASKRNVEVRIVLPGKTDSGLVMHASRSFYDQMFACGIHVHQLKIAVLHAKTAVIDGVWATVGSTNIDTRSFLHNNEINIVVFDPEFGAAMEGAFAEDLRISDEITQKQWGERSWSDKLKEWTSRRLEYWL